MKQLLMLCTKNVHFTFDSTVYQQNDVVAMESPLRPVLSGIFMAELQNSLATLWRRFIEGRMAFVKNDSIVCILD